MSAFLQSLPISGSIDEPEAVYCEYCKKEKAQVLRDIPLIGKRWTVIACECELKELEERKEEQKQRKKRLKINRLLRLSSANEDLRKMTFDNYHIRNGCEHSYEEVMDAVKNFKKREKLGFMIFGETGNGKTHLTAAGANALIDQNYSVIFLTEKDLLSRLQATKRFSNQDSFTDIMNACLEADLLIWDDFLSSQRLTYEEKDWIFQIVNGRERANRPIWATSNLSPEEFQNPNTAFLLDDKGRTWWRLIANMNCIYNSATNYRAIQAMERMRKSL